MPVLRRRAAPRSRDHGDVAGNRHERGGVSGQVGGAPASEQQLVDRARAGDARAYEELVRLHQQIAFRTAIVLAGSAADAEEAVQDAFVKAWRGLGSFRAGAPFRPWLLAIVANEARTRRRASTRRAGWTERAAEQARATGAVAAPSAEADALGRERREALLAALDRLPDRDRRALELRYLVGLSEREMAAALGVRPGTVKSRLSRALDRMRAELGERS
jgi:RNA polymerase sigma-70 factor (ECF subfamily)